MRSRTSSGSTRTSCICGGWTDDPSAPRTIRLTERYSWSMKRAWKNPRPTLAAYGAPLARLLPKRTGRPAYYPRVLGGRRGRALADLNTPPVVASWGFRMNETEDDLRTFVEKHRA